MKITLPEGDCRILAARYQSYLPTEEALRAEIARSREEVEHRIKLQAGTTRGGKTKPRRRRPARSSGA